ncbi:UNVERIFIED_CONTAM: hypothetical protein RMT77_008319 [Armadillidium vulgare]
MTNLQGVNKGFKYTLKYPDVPSAIKPIPRGSGIPVTGGPRSINLDKVSDDEISNEDNFKTFILPSSGFNEPTPLAQVQLSNLKKKDLGLLKEFAQLLGSRLIESNLLAPEAFYWYRNRDQEFSQFFSLHENSSLVYCSEIKGLIEALGAVYKPSEWRLFVDSSSRSLKVVQLHNSNFLGSVTVGYSIQRIENHDNMKILLDALKYCDPL